MNNFLVRSVDESVSAKLLGAMFHPTRPHPIVNAMFGLIGGGLGIYSALGNEWLAAAGAAIGGLAAYFLTHKIPN